MAFDKLVDSAKLDGAITATANAIREKTETTEKIAWNPETGFSDAIEAIEVGGSGGSSSVSKKDVNFYDYDGTLLHSYTVAEAQALSELPALPERDGLICQGWNYDLETIKAYNWAVNVGATYITDDGATRLHIRISTAGRSTVPLKFNQTVTKGVAIDWGDGTAVETSTKTGNVSTSHTYAMPGEYVISLLPSDNCNITLSDGATSSNVLGSTSNTGIVYTCVLQAVNIGKNVKSIGISAFNSSYSMKKITIPDGVTSIADHAFQNCNSIETIIVPKNVASIGDRAFYQMYSLSVISIPNNFESYGEFTFCYNYGQAEITIPKNVTSIGNSAFRYCRATTRITFLSDITYFGSSAFSDCKGVRYLDFTNCTRVPALSSTGVFYNMNDDVQILVPAVLYDEWRTATNWATYASKIVAV